MWVLISSSVSCSGAIFVFGKDFSTISNNSNFFLPKITNYSISKFTTKQNGFSIKNHTSFIAPETVKKLELTKSSNVYSFGIIIYEIFTNDLPPIIFKFLFHSNIPSPYLNLIKSCISQDPQKRPTFDEILDQLKNNHDFIIENVNEKDFSDYVNYIEKSLNGSNVEQFINLKSKTFNDFNGILSPFDKNKNKFIDLDQFYILNRIGEGGYGKCFLVKEANTNKKYVAKVLKKQISNDYMHNEETLLFFREVKLMSILNHPSIIKFIGFSPVDFNQSFHPVIITQFAKNKTLKHIIDLEKSKLNKIGWNDTKKLINIYGIAAGMLYLHSNDVIHRDLKPSNILMDENLFPKIADFGLSKAANNKSQMNSLSIDSKQLTIHNSTKGTTLYMPPEILEQQLYSKSGDVFSFSLIIYEIFALNNPFSNLYPQQLYYKIVVAKERPVLTKDIPQPFINLISRCWDQNPDKRPTFEKIINDLKTNKEYITQNINKKEYYDFINFIDKAKSSFKLENSIRFDELATSIKTSNEANDEETDYIGYNESDFDDYTLSSNNYTGNSNNDTENSNNNICDMESAKINEQIDRIREFIENKTNLDDLENDFQKKLLHENPQVLFIVGKCLIEGLRNFQKNIELGEKFLEQSISSNNDEFLIYYCTLLIEGKLINRDIEKAKSYIEHKLDLKDKNIMFLYGKILQQENKYFDAIRIIEESANQGNIQAMYEYGKMLFFGEGCTKDDHKAMKYFHLSKLRGCEDSQKFLITYYKIIQIDSFINLDTQTQMFFFSQIIENNFVDMKIPEKASISSNFYDLFNLEKSNANEKNNFVDMKIPEKASIPSDFYDLFNLEKLNINEENNLIDTKIRKEKWKRIDIKSDKNNFLFLNGIIGSNNFIRMLTHFEDISIHIVYQPKILKIFSDSFLRYIGIDELNIKISINIPCSISSINSCIFKGFFHLKEISIPSSVTSIGEAAFCGCSSLTQISIPSTITKLEKEIFKDCSSLKQTSIPSCVTSIGEAAFCGCSSLMQISIPSTITKLEKEIFKDCSSLKQISIPSCVTSIGEAAFCGCSSLMQISIPPTIIKLEKEIFKDCSSLTQILIPSNVTSIGEAAFYGCSSLIQISIPNSVTLIEINTFYMCTSLKDITIPSSITSYGKKSFYECSSLLQISISTSVKSIGDDAFRRCKSLTQIVFPSSLKSISNYSFSECCSLASISFPSTLTSIGKGAFFGCESLVQIEIPSSVIEIKDDAFRNCVSLKNVIILSPKILLGEYIFANCQSLEKFSVNSSMINLIKKTYNWPNTIVEAM